MIFGSTVLAFGAQDFIHQLPKLLIHAPRMHQNDFELKDNNSADGLMGCVQYIFQQDCQWQRGLSE